MKFIWNVSNTKSVKWVYSCILSVMSFKRFYPGSEFIVYYDTNETRQLLEDHLADVEFIETGDWCDEICKKTGLYTKPFGSGCFNLFKAIEDYSDFFFLDCDCFCTGEIEFSKDRQISAMERLNVPLGYSRCAVYVDGKVDFKVSDIKLRGLQTAWGDEILFKTQFREIISPVKFKNIVHLGTEPWRFKTKTLNLSLFNRIYRMITDKTDVPRQEYENFIFK